MYFVAALVVLVGVVCTLDLLFTVRLTRLVRALPAPAGPSGHSGPPALPGRLPDLMLPVGEVVGPFEAVTADGEVRRGPTLTPGRTLVGVFTKNCPPCAERVPQFLEAAKNHPHGRDAVLAVLVTDGEDVSDYRDTLQPVAHVIVERKGEAATRALGVRGYPALAVLDERGGILAAGTIMAHVEPAL
ncbi:TlpA disulfide reductase family protein [Streptosporangium sandarakinum]|uniref:TlpA disulfide reductase family protein n=1 Tax=Streptosporangium sandarakinum TaxID=1260955 RepID=UPI00342FD28D